MWSSCCVCVSTGAQRSATFMRQSQWGPCSTRARGTCSIQKKNRVLQLDRCSRVFSYASERPIRREDQARSDCHMSSLFRCFSASRSGRMYTMAFGVSVSDHPRVCNLFLLASSKVGASRLEVDDAPSTSSSPRLFSAVPTASELAVVLEDLHVASTSSFAGASRGYKVFGYIDAVPWAAAPLSNACVDPGFAPEFLGGPPWLLPPLPRPPTPREVPQTL